MDRESLERLRFDRRLQNRRGWLGHDELDRHLATLPDVADKLTTLAEKEEAAGAPANSGDDAPSGS